MSPPIGGRPTCVLQADPAATVVLTRDDTEIARWSIAGVCCDLAVVDRLARLQLAARRLGCSIHVRDAGVDLAALLELIGLAGELPVRQSSR
jgi:hypothetical protein